MSWSTIKRRLRALFRRGAVEREMEDELALHLELHEQALVREGVPRDEARRRTRAAFGSQVTREAYRDARGVRPLEDLGRDIAYALRSLRRRRVFTLITVLTIALGISAATSIYTIVDGVLLKPLPYRNSGRLVQVLRTFPSWKKEPVLAGMWDHSLLSIPDYRQIRDGATDLTSVAIWQNYRRMMTVGNETERVAAVATTPEMLDVLGVRPYRGRFFLPVDDVPGAPGVALVSYEAWQTRFGGDPKVLGRALQFDEREYTIIGILPRGLNVGRRNPDPVVGPPVLWIPLGPVSGDDYNERTNHGENAIARLAPGVTVVAAEAQARALLADPRDSGRVGTRVVVWKDFETQSARRPLLLLLGGAGLLLVIACVNVATLLLGEAAAREQEIAARRALGGGRWRLMRQLLTESLVLSVLGGAAGVAAGWLGMHVLVALAPRDIPGLTTVTMDGRVALAAVLAVVATGLVFGAIPSLMLSRTEPAEVLRAGAGQSGRGHGMTQRWLVAGEFALSLMLLSGAGLLVRSFRNLTAVDPGFRPAGVSVVNPSVPRALMQDSAQLRQVYDRVLARVANLPGIAAAVEATDPPFDGENSSSFTIEGEAGLGAGAPAQGRYRHQADQNAVGVGYFRLMGIPLVAGRAFGDGDRGGAPAVAVVSEALARRDFPGGSPLGMRVRYQGEWRTIVGVVGDVHIASMRGAVRPTIYTPIRQREMSGPYLVLRSSGTPLGRRQLQAAITPVDSRFVVTEVHAMTSLMDGTVAADRYRATLMTLFGVLAGALSAVGMYGVTARAAARRRRETGIRLALGAPVRAVVGGLVRTTVVGAVAGLAVGLVATMVAARALLPFLFGVAPHDPATIGPITTLLVVTAVVAAWLPARRASRLDVVEVLRRE
jgi:putative ABC transport system permease protein